MISNNEGKFHYLLVRDLSALVYGRTKQWLQARVTYCLCCFSQARLLTAHLPDCSVHPEQKVRYPYPTILRKYKKFKDISKTLPVSFVYTPTLRPSWYLLKKILRALQTQSYDNSTNLAGSPAFESPRYRSLMGRYSHTAEKTRSPSSSKTFEIRTTTCEASYRMWNRWRL